MIPCRHRPGASCVVEACPGRTDPGVCRHLEALAANRALSPAQRRARDLASRGELASAVRDAVNACTDRGPVLPISLQDDCGCRGKEVSECRAGKGKVPGRVTLRDCLECRS